MKIRKKIIWLFKRHPFLYKVRFKLLSSTVNQKAIENEFYNKYNSKVEIPNIFFEKNSEIFSKGKPNSTLQTVIEIGSWLVKNIKGGRGLSLPSDESLKIMLEGEAGVCSDVAQVFNNFCVVNDIKVREWGITKIPFDEKYGGHSVNEIYSDELNKWILVDVYKGLFFKLNETSNYASALEVFSKKEKKIIYEAFVESKNIDRSKIDDYYINPQAVPFLIVNYSTKVYDKFLKVFYGYLPIFVIHFIVFCVKKSYKYMFPLTDYKKMFK